MTLTCRSIRTVLSVTAPDEVLDLAVDNIRHRLGPEATVTLSYELESIDTQDGYDVTTVMVLTGEVVDNPDV